MDSNNLIDIEQADADWKKNTKPLMSHAGSINGFKASGQYPGKNQEIYSDQPTSNSSPTGNPSLETPTDSNGHPAASRYNVFDSKAAREYWDAEFARLKCEEKAGSLIQSKVVRRVLYEASRIIRVGHDNIVSQLAPTLASETNITNVERILKRGLDQLDTDLADSIANLENTLLDEQSREEQDDQEKEVA